MLYYYTTVSCKGVGCDHANMFDPATSSMYVSLPNLEPVIQWLSFVSVTYLFFVHFLVHKLGRYFSRLNCFILSFWGLL